ncbi:MAG: gas vesicle protein GvpN [Candidatus Methanoperedens sp.]|nr:gas vesicle protein GvpN [Candidatus Methanoperedens sp.]MCE8428538.1 gas vesicle protein GvpN [Candidatus Methanoperedens sp.]
MNYIETHPRKVRGGSVHKTIRDKKEERPVKARAKQQLRQKKVSNTSSNLNERKTVEETYLSPDVSNFVEANDVNETKKRIKLWLKTGYPVHLIGPTGCGKTSLAMHVAKEMNRPVVWINGDESITTTDLIGGYSQIEQESLRDQYVHNVFKSKDILKADWVDNPLALACKYGYTLIYNEFSRTKPAANNILLSVFEEKILELPTKFGEDRYIKVHPDFKAILTSNSIEYAGVHRPQDALLDRLVTIYMDYYSFDTEVSIVNAHTGVPDNDARRIVSVVRSLREKLPDTQKPGTRACIMIGEGLKALNGQGRMNFEQICIDVMATKTRSSMELIEKQTFVKEAIEALA